MPVASGLKVQRPVTEEGEGYLPVPVKAHTPVEEYGQPQKKDGRKRGGDKPIPSRREMIAKEEKARGDEEQDG